MSENFDIEELLRTHLADGEMAAPEGLFADIDAGIAVKEKRKRRGLILFWFGLLSFLMLLLFAISYVWNNSLHTERNYRAPHGNLTLRKNISFATDNATSEFVQDTTNKHSLPAFAVDSNTHLKEITNETLSSSSLKPGKEQPKNTSFSENTTTSDPKRNPAQSNPTSHQTSTTSDRKGIVTDSTEKGESLPDHQAKDALITKNGLDTPSSVSSSQQTGADGAPDLGEEIHTTDSTLTEHSTLSDTIGNTEDNDQASTKLVHEPNHLTSPFLMPPYAEREPSSSFGIVLQGGPLYFSGNHLKPYFKSSDLNGMEFGLGITYQLPNGLLFELNGNWNQLRSGFQYDLLVSEEDYFDLYAQSLPIPLENLDDPSDCNCYLVEGVSLDYSLRTTQVGLRIGYEIFPQQKISLIPSLTLNGSIQQRYTTVSSSVIAFPETIQERGMNYQFGGSVYVGYQVFPKVSLGVNPSFSQSNFIGSSEIQASFRRFFVPVALRFTF